MQCPMRRPAVHQRAGAAICAADFFKKSGPKSCKTSAPNLYCRAGMARLWAKSAYSLPCGCSVRLPRLRRGRNLHPKGHARLDFSRSHVTSPHALAPPEQGSGWAGGPRRYPLFHQTDGFLRPPRPLSSHSATRRSGDKASFSHMR